MVVPPLFLILNLGTTFMIIRLVFFVNDSTPNFIKEAYHGNINDDILTILGLYLLPITSIFTIAFYLMASYINPGFIIGNEEVQLAKA